MISGIKCLQFVYKFSLEKFTICAICPKTGRVVRARPDKKKKWFSPLFGTNFSIVRENPLVVIEAIGAIGMSNIANHFFEEGGRFAGDSFSGGKIIGGVLIHFVLPHFLFCTYIIS